MRESLTLLQRAVGHRLLAAGRAEEAARAKAAWEAGQRAPTIFVHDDELETDYQRANGHVSAAD